ncbi:MAG TPA: hypothetical protein VGA37_00820 [Gemmatimonadales bacterium]
MRFLVCVAPHRLAVATCLASLLVTSACDDDVAGTGDTTGVVALSLALPSTAFIQSARVILQRGDGSIAKDTVLTIAEDQDSVSVNLQVLILGGAETFGLTLTLRDAAGSTLFQAGPVNVTANGTGGSAPVSLTLVYVGVGANAAAVRITNASAAVRLNDSVTMVAVAVDSAGEPIPGTPILWRSLSPDVADFPLRELGNLVAGSELGSVSVIAELFTGQADTASVGVVGATDLGAAIQAFEDQMFLAITTAIDDSTFDREQVIDWPAADLISFEPARLLFDQAYQLDPGNDTAAFGLAMTTILALKENTLIRTQLQAWDDWAALNATEYGVDSLFQSSGPFPPTPAEMQPVIRDVILPALMTALGAIESMGNSNFQFVFTDRMQGRTAPSGDEDEVPREFDYADVQFAKAAYHAVVALANGALAYQVTPDPYGPSGLTAALSPGSTFGMLATGGAGYLSAARTHLQDAVMYAQAGLDALELETDVQDNDVIIYRQACCPSGLAEFDDLAIADARRVLGEIAASLNGPAAWNEDFQDTGIPTTVMIDLSRMLLNPVADLKALLPSYQSFGGKFRWNALAFDEWVIPDPTVNNTFPGIMTSDSLKYTFELEDLWYDGAFRLDEWYGLTQYLDGSVYALTFQGLMHHVPLGFGSETFIDALPFDPLGFNHYTSLTINPGTAQLWAIDFNGDLYVHDGESWTLRSQGLCCYQQLSVHPSVAGVMYAYDGVSLYEYTPDGAQAFFRPQNFFWSDRGITPNPVTGDLAVLSWDGVLSSWSTLDTLSPWIQQITLPAVMTPGSYDEWQSLTTAPSGTSLWAVTRHGGVVEISGDYATADPRPRVPASNVVRIMGNLTTAELVAMTSDGRLFTKPADAATPWTQRFTLFRFVLDPIE